MRERKHSSSAMLLTRTGEVRANQRLSVVSLAPPTDSEPEILLIASTLGCQASYALDYDDAVALRDWLSAWIGQGKIDPPVELDEWKDLDPERIVMLTGPGDHSAMESVSADVTVERCPECGWATIHTRDCSRRGRG